LEFFRSLYADGVIARSTLLVDYRGAANRFVGNKAASLVDGDWRARDFLALPPEKRRYIQLALFPEIAASGLNQSSFVIPGPGWDINALLQENSTEERADWRFVQRLSGREIQEWLPGYRATGLPGCWAAGLLGSGGITTPSGIDIARTAWTGSLCKKPRPRSPGRRVQRRLTRFSPRKYPLNDGL
jgi:hypothetical protein